jgi:hypothetical protein
MQKIAKKPPQVKHEPYYLIQTPSAAYRLWSFAMAQHCQSLAISAILAIHGNLRQANS